MKTRLFINEDAPKSSIFGKSQTSNSPRLLPPLGEVLEILQNPPQDPDTEPTLPQSSCTAGRKKSIREKSSKNEGKLIVA